MTTRDFSPARLVTLTTDFGLEEPFVGIMKGRMLRRSPEPRVVDLTHLLPAHEPRLAGFWLGRAWREFPPGTVHVAVVDPGVGTARAILLALCDGHAFLAPDNGLLPEALRGVSPSYRSLDPALAEEISGGRISRTFHGRDLFAPLAADLAVGRLPPGDFGPAATPADPSPLPLPREADGAVEGTVIVSDRFGNLITNIGAGLLEGTTQPVAEIGGRQVPLLATYGQGKDADLVAVINAFELVEIAAPGARAADMPGLGPGAAVRITDGISA